MQAAGNCQPDDGYRYALLIADCLRTVGGRGYRGGCVGGTISGDIQRAA